MWGNVLKVKQQTEKAQSVPVSAWVSRACCHQRFWPECKFKIQFLQIVSTWAYYSLFICPIPANSHILWCVQLERTCNGCKYCWCEFTKGFKWLFLLVLWHSLSSVCCHAVSSHPLFPGDIHQGSKHCNLMQRKNRSKFLSQVKSLIAQLVTDKKFLSPGFLSSSFCLSWKTLIYSAHMPWKLLLLSPPFYPSSAQKSEAVLQFVVFLPQSKPIREVGFFPCLPHCLVPISDRLLASSCTWQDVSSDHELVKWGPKCLFK